MLLELPKYMVTKMNRGVSLSKVPQFVLNPRNLAVIHGSKEENWGLMEENWGSREEN